MVPAVRESTALDRPHRDVVSAYVLLLPALFGLSGLHRFYLGRWASGVIWLVTGGLCGIGSVIDMVMLPRMVDDANRGAPGW
ncbi:MAG: TM2 domain-containing protein [Pseudomonadota bacterium]